MSKLVELISLVKQLPENSIAEALEKIRGIKERSDLEEEATDFKCISCNSQNIVRNGRKCRKQSYLCKECHKSFVSTSQSAIQNSHSGSAVWRQVISDTVNGVSIDTTATNLDLHHETVFNMRHKILYCIEQSLIANPTILSGVCETDETYVLENVKGSKIPEDYHRKPRKHGAVASKPGISNEYVCVCTSVTGNGENVAVSANRATPSSRKILEIFGERVNEETVVLCDGAQSYNILEDKCRVATTKKNNKVNGFHSFIKKRLRAARGIATIYLNRYNALFAKIYDADKSIVDNIWKMMTAQNGEYNTIPYTQSEKLLNL
jgi:transposase-like protein